MIDDNLDDWFFEDKPKYKCCVCEENAIYRYKCGDYLSVVEYVCKECLDEVTCHMCVIEII